MLFCLLYLDVADELFPVIIVYDALLDHTEGIPCHVTGISAHYDIVQVPVNRRVLFGREILKNDAVLGQLVKLDDLKALRLIIRLPTHLLDITDIAD